MIYKNLAKYDLTQILITYVATFLCLRWIGIDFQEVQEAQG
jgi:hypothetical protein